MEKKFDPRGKERKRTNRKKWYKAVCSLAAAVVVCTVYTLMLPALTLDEESAGDAGVTISESSVPTSEAPAAESSKSDNGSENQNDTAADSSADSSHAATESGPAAAAPSDDRAPSTTNPTTEGEHNAPVTLPTEETNSGAITGSSESHDEVTSPDTDDQEKIKDEENNDSPAADKEETDEEEADNSGSSSDADTEEDDSEKSDDTADVETASYWETTIPDLSDCETWAEKLLAVAGSQLGYHESILNFRVDNKGEHKGYTRYGEWYGNPYGDWCAMFVSFCLKYAGIDEEAIPQNANCSDWVKNLKEMEIYEDADLYVPEAGDIVFFDQSDADRPNHVGIISEVTYGTKTVIRHITKDGSAIESGAMNALKYINEATSDDASGDELRTEEVEVPVAESIKVIEGNSSDQVQYVDYDLSNEKILGYISLTNAKNVYEGVEEQKPVEEQEIEPLKYEGSDYVIKVEYTEEAQLPEGVHLEAEELREGTEAYEDYYNRTVEKLMDESTAENEDDLGISFARFFDLKFITTEGEEIEPAAPVSVKIRYTDRVEVNDDQTATVVHFAKTTETAETDDSWTSKSDISKFSTFALRPAALASDESSDESADRTDNVNEIPEIITPEEVTNSTFEFVQDSFSVTATVIRNASNETLVDGKQYLIYAILKETALSDDKENGYDPKESNSSFYKITSKYYALTHNNNNLGCKKIQGVSSKDPKLEQPIKSYDKELLWTYGASEKAFYYIGDDGKEYYLNGESISESSKPLTIAGGKISLNKKYICIIDKEYGGKQIVVSPYMTRRPDNATSFNFAEIDTVPNQTGGEFSETQLGMSKYVTKLENKTYDLTLTVSGKVGTEKNKAKLDIIYVMDVSGSMEDYSRLDNAKNAIKNITSNFKNNSNLDTRVSLVTFGSKAAINCDWTRNQVELEHALDNRSANGATNYEDAMVKAKKLLEDSRAGATKVIIFASDGNPTTSSVFDPDVLAKAQVEVSNMSSLNYFYTIGIGSSDNYARIKALIDLDTDEQYNYKENTGRYNYEYDFFGNRYSGDEYIPQAEFPKTIMKGHYDASDASDLTKAFSSIEESVTTYKCTNVVVTDTLSKYAEAVPGASPRVSIKNNETVAYVDVRPLGNNDFEFTDDLGKKIKIHATLENGKIIMTFPSEYELDPKYTFEVTLNIKPTKYAESTYIQNKVGSNDGYNNSGDEGTGITSAGKRGFHSNNKATVECIYKNEPKSFEYLHPVIQVEVQQVELPETGGPGTALLYLLSVLLLAAPLTIILIKRRRTERKEH